MDSHKSTQVALGGVFSALCLLSMFMTSLIPFASFALPMLAGTMLYVVVIENGARTALLVYISVSLLSLFIVPDLDAKLLFILFFGYYSIIKPLIDKLPSKLISTMLKFAIFNAAIAAWYLLSTKLFGVDAALAENGFFATYGVPIIFISLNVTLFVYDVALTRYMRIYIFWFRPTFLRR